MKIPDRIIDIKREADKLLEEKFYRSAITLYAAYSERQLLTSFLYIKREKDGIDETIRLREIILTKKEKIIMILEKNCICI